MLNYCGRLIHHPDRDDTALYPQVQEKASLRLYCRCTNISWHYVHACNALHLHFKMYSLPIGRHPQIKRCSREPSPVSSSWVSHLDYGADGSPATALGQDTLERIYIGFLTVLVLLCISGLVEMDCGWTWRSWDRVFIIQVSASALVSLCFSFCVQMSFLSYDITLRGSRKVFLPQFTNTCLEHT